MRNPEITNFDLNLIKLMKILYSNNLVDDAVMDTLRELDLDYMVLLKKNMQLDELVNLDAKTRLLKYREDYLSMILKSASRVIEKYDGEFKVSYVRFDIDDFSRMNNRYGHDFGDTVLVDFASLLKTYSRPTDYVIRYGGEEFDIILPSTGYEGAISYVKKIYERMNTLNYLNDGDGVTVTASAGISLYSMVFDDIKAIDSDKLKHDYIRLQKLADDALYEAKVSGKNCYRVYSRNVDYSSIRKEYSRMSRLN